ncbi:MAG: hypothetical protein LRY55_10745 [Leadbetterella sp.]|nr:hypothetical protein [Leadbetterella sp.]
MKVIISFVAVNGKGLDYTHLDQVIFRHLLNKEEAIQQGVDNTITGIQQMPGGEVWCSTGTDGILVFDSDFQTLRKHHLKGKSIHKIIRLEAGKVLVELKDFSYRLYDDRKKTFSIYHPAGLPAGITNSVKNKEETLLYSRQGAARYHPGGKPEILKILNSTIEWSHISHVCFISDNEILVQTFYTSLFYAKREGADFRVARELCRTPFNINASVKAGDTIYLATTSGLKAFNIPGKQLEERTLLPAYCSGVVAKGKEELWISSNNGLYRLTLKSGKISHFTESDGLQGPVFHPGTLTVLQDGKIAVAGNNGINTFTPESMKEKMLLSKHILLK